VQIDGVNTARAGRQLSSTRAATPLAMFYQMESYCGLQNKGLGLGRLLDGRYDLLFDIAPLLHVEISMVLGQLEISWRSWP
jgi:hypothetical protein